MRTTIVNPCSRCGKERIVSRTWKEKLETSFGNQMVIYSESVCPDKECQKIVDKELAAQKKSRDKIKSDKEAKMKLMKKNSKSRVVAKKPVKKVAKKAKPQKSPRRRR